jgi:hypothetical protein
MIEPTNNKTGIFATKDELIGLTPCSTNVSAWTVVGKYRD